MNRFIIALTLYFQIPADLLHAQTAREIIARVEQRTSVQLPATTVDTFKAGNPDTRVTGIAVTMMATLDVLQRAAARGHNLIITHEPSFYSHRDATDVLEKEADSVYMAKAAFIAEHGLVVWRFHDRPHAMQPDMIRQGTVDALSWARYQNPKSPNVFDLPPVTIGELAKSIGKILGANVVRIVGDPSAQVSRIGLTFGFPGFAGQRKVLQFEGLDVLVMGEDHEWETIAYGADAVTAGQRKGLIVIGHIASEQAGMESVTRWMRTFITGVPVEFVPARDPFSSVH